MEEAQIDVGGKGGTDLVTFLRDSASRLLTGTMLLPAIVLTFFLTASNIFILMNMPQGGDLPP